MKRVGTAGAAMVVLCLALTTPSVGFAGEAAPMPVLEPVPEQMDPVWNAVGVGEYIKDRFGTDAFAGVYLEYEQEPVLPGAEATLVVSLTETLSVEEQEAVRAKAGSFPAVRFRTVKYSLEELRSKQHAIEQALEESTAIVTVGVDLPSNRVVVGILPFSEEEAGRIYERFGREMVEVVESPPVTMYVDAAAETSVAVGITGATGDSAAASGPGTGREASGFLTRVLRWVQAWLGGLLG